ncbi:hypothetical protein CISIN_1g0354642mg [Citrus sinensis]|uniref:Uncharacterized protein n=1 Tax=Citrus sinensis TaxID=2711 RepID=A0A067DF82_CITSI|nr:hypothetical protein CISIN_1g0354642mg [Citrus sinensis]
MLLQMLLSIFIRVKVLARWLFALIQPSLNKWQSYEQFPCPYNLPSRQFWLNIKQMWQ